MAKPLKLTIIASKPTGWHPRQLMAAAKKQGIHASAMKIKSEDLADPSLTKKLGDVVIWRGSGLEESERWALRDILKGKTVINESIFKVPAVRFKYAQQSHLKSLRGTKVWSIPSYKASDLEELKACIKKRELSYPFIAKPDVGSKGRGISLIKNSNDLSDLTDIRNYVFQNFLVNDGDWRVIVVGGAPLAAMKRVAAKGKFVNNISQGATSLQETDEAILKQLFEMAAKTASAFNMVLGGIDIIRDQKSGKFYILEVNTIPAWDEEFGFQSITGINVAEQIIGWVVERGQLERGRPIVAIEAYFKNRIAKVSQTHSLHMASRLWLWNGDKWGRGQLDKHEDDFIGKDDERTRQIIRQIIERPPQLVNQTRPARAAAFKRHPKLPVYNQVLYKMMCAQTLYGRDIRHIVREFISDRELLRCFATLRRDGDAVRVLSTHAVNYFYWVNYYFHDQPEKLSEAAIDPRYFLKLLPGYDNLESKGVLDRKLSLKYQLYLLTHAIIGQSLFYARPVEDPVYIKLCQRLEQLVRDNYFKASLDNKFEFLVCAALCGYESSLTDVINQEARESVSWAGNFLVGSRNPYSVNHCLLCAEHRNTLYLMTQKEFKKAPSSKKPEILLNRTIGSFEKVSLPDFGLMDVVAKIDTGATTGSLHATNIKEVTLPTGETALSFLPYGRKPGVTVRSFTVKMVRSSNGDTAMRYVIPTTLVFGGVQYPIRLTLADRTPMKKGILIGRRFLRSHGFVVDVKKGTKYRGEVKS